VRASLSIWERAASAPIDSAPTALCRRYSAAMAAVGIACHVTDGDAAVEGFRRLDALKSPNPAGLR
jgi:hypothetical protein